ncbi:MULTISPECIES: GMP/IMP nucleotidase [unclassified Alcanivorax]|jgi:putative hydrolase of the HAD superfamily|uniref:GMP/IMP nucleotidase n=2 Tax=Alcanivorax TaxID=59753 RepID=UPI000789C538|nr:MULTISPECIES: GMP/IMP nucleotidase [unclassified Alcanivorax]KZX80051.1 haloacid dehalogenase [Alcanivorax sp. HI0011]KZX85060.1 haloacid dehalogenase [Alcanivorax sp. HI0013]KZY12577.1 haloacid dehalogenase [Alcanivorax sp. HI0035]MEE2603712.1 GMP/IMP nucleotidase [Pseudomonadota bacterium]KZX61486.1 haloacid dehalogenase [Alcanivorax sp. HI0003]|tara:strand:- start:16 stop:669 length:654 start_codon:yes stop_codon:yes gene_type:complete
MIDWHSVDTVLLDMDGTLLDLEFDNWFWQKHVPECYARQQGLDRAEADRIIHDWITSHLGTLNWYCLDFWTAELGLEIARLKRQAGDRIAIRPGADTFLQALKESDKQVIMVTNAHRDALDLKVERTGIDRYFDEIVSSHDYGHAKEAQAFWQHLQRHLPFDPARALLVDDSLPVLHSAQLYGIGQPVSILHPDSSLPKRDHTDPFPAIDDFLQVLP